MEMDDGLGRADGELAPDGSCKSAQMSKNEGRGLEGAGV